MTSAERQRGYRDAINGANVQLAQCADGQAYAIEARQTLLEIKALLSSETVEEGDKADTDTTPIPAVPTA
jgi:hypothetical protein